MPSKDRKAARLKLVEEHIRCENNHDLDAIVGTFGEAALYQDETWAERYEGLNGIRAFYEALMAALPDLQIAIRDRHISEETIILEVIVSGTHLGNWRELPPTGRQVALPLCAIYTFTDDDKLAGERIYYDRATLFRQLGLFHEPTTALGRLTTALIHPISVARAYTRRIRPFTNVNR